MGRELKLNVYVVFILVFIPSYFFCNAQQQLSGKVIDSLGNGISASVILKDTTLTEILNYTYTDNQGLFKLQLPSKGAFNLEITSLGYKAKSLKVNTIQIENNKTLQIKLSVNPTTLDEVIITAERPMVVKKDTVSFKTNYFTNGTEETAEDVLKKIPGLTITENGQIKVNNVEIEKLMVDGDDFFEKGYRLLSKNMPAHPIEAVEIYKNYSNNALLKNIENTNKVALNLKLNKNAKRIWFGNLKLNIGVVNAYKASFNVMNFGKKNKYFFLGHVNNIGVSATADTQYLIDRKSLQGLGKIGDEENIEPLLNLQQGGLGFSVNRTNFNNEELLSLNAIFNPTKKLKIKALSVFNCDENDVFKNTTENTNFNTTNFINTEDYVFKNRTKTAYGNIDMSYALAKHKTLNVSSSYSLNSNKNTSDLLFNTVSTNEVLRSNKTFLDQKVHYTQKITSKKALLLTARFKHQQLPQNYKVNQYLFSNLFPEVSTADAVEQHVNATMNFAGFNAHLLARSKKNHLLEFQLGNSYRSNKLNTQFSILNNQFIVAKPLEYQNNIRYTTNNVFLKSKFIYSFKNIDVDTQLNFHQLFNTLSNTTTNQQSSFFVNPNININWKLNTNNTLAVGYQYSTVNANTIEVIDGYVLRGFRSFYKSTGAFNQLNNSVLSLNYRTEGWRKKFFINTYALLSRQHDYFTNSSLITQNYSLNDNVLVKNSNMLILNSDVSYYLKLFKSNIKLKFNYDQNKRINSVNAGPFRNVKMVNFNYGLELRSGFSGIFNYHVGHKWKFTQIQTNTTNGFTDMISFLDVSFNFNKQLDFQLQSERYYFGNLQTDNTYYFLDFDARYKLIENKLTLGLTGKNLFNTTTFRNFNISDIGTSTTEYRLLPRFVLLKLEYRF